MININDVKIIKKIGSGVRGTIYLVSYNDKKYALKIEKILEEYIKESLKSQIWREIDFCNKMKKYNTNNNFMTLYSHDVIDNCKHAQNYDFKVIPDDLLLLSNSKYCSRKLYSLVDTTVSKYLKFMKLKDFYSMILQVGYSIYLMKSKGFFHRDLHDENIGILKTKKKFVSIFDLKVKTNGYIYQVVDYGAIINKKYPMTAIEKELFKHNDESLDDMKNFCLSVCIDHTFWKYVRKNKLETISFDIVRKQILDSYEYKTLNAIKNEDDRMELYALLYPKKYQMLLLGKKFEKTIYPKYNIPVEDFIYFYLVGFDIKKIIKYVQSKEL